MEFLKEFLLFLFIIEFWNFIYLLVVKLFCLKNILICCVLILYVVVFIGYFDEYVFLVYGGWVDNEKIG